MSRISSIGWVCRTARQPPRTPSSTDSTNSERRGQWPISERECDMGDGGMPYAVGQPDILKGLEAEYNRLNRNGRWLRIQALRTATPLTEMGAVAAMNPSVGLTEAKRHLNEDWLGLEVENDGTAKTDALGMPLP